jgi:hypothetical protein
MRQKVGVFSANVAAGVVSLLNPSIILPQTHYLMSLFFNIAVAGTNTVGGGTVIEDALARSFNLRVFLEGDDPVLSLRGDNLKQYLVCHYDAPQDYTEVANAKGAFTGSWNFELPIADKSLRNNPKLTRVDLALVENPRVEMDFPATGASMNSDAVLTSVQVTMSAELEARPAGLPGADVLGRYLPLRRIRAQTKPDLVASTADQQVRVPFGRLVREYLFITRDRSATPARTDAVVSQMEIAPNLARPGKKLWTDLRSETQTTMTTARPTGVVRENFDHSRQLVGSGMLNLVGTRDAVLNVDTNAAANGLDFVTIEESIDFANPRNVALVQALAKRMRGA